MNCFNKLKGYLFVIISAVGCAPMMVKFIYDAGVSAVGLIFLRDLISLPFLAFLTLREGKKLKAPVHVFRFLGLAGILGCSITPMLLFSSYQYIASGTATVFYFVYPAVVMVGGILFLKERIVPVNLMGVLICVLGVTLFYNPGEPIDWRGAVLALLSGVAYASYILILNRVDTKTVSGFQMSFCISLISSVAMLVVCLATRNLSFPGTALGWLLCLVFSACNVGAMVLFQRGTLLVGGQRASILSTLEPITSILVGALVLQEALGFRTVVGTILVILPTILIVLVDSEKKKSLSYQR